MTGRTESSRKGIQRRGRPATRVRLGVVADDDTGATDAAGMLTERGVRTLVALDAGELEQRRKSVAGYDAVVIGTQSRSIAPDEARRRTAAAVAALIRAGVHTLQIKYSSTFDSTPQGNIGPSLDAALDATGQRTTVVCPALPVHGRTVYQGYLFVHGRLLSESPLRDHPLNPMTDPDIVRWLERQTPRKTGRVPLELVRRGAKALEERLRELRAKGVSYAVVDATEDSDLDALAVATARDRLVSGASGLTAALARRLFGRRRPLRYASVLRRAKGPTIVVAGSQSPATRRQNAYAAGHGLPVVAVDAAAVVRGALAAGHIAAMASAALSEAGTVLVCTTDRQTGNGREAQAVGRAMGLSAEQTGERIAEALAGAAAALVTRTRPGLLVVSGGETSGAVCRALGIRAFEAGPVVEPGVPLCFPLDRKGSVMALKSGNFGSDDFYLRCRKMVT